MAAFREQDFGEWTGRRHNDLVTELGDAYQKFWKSPAGNRPPGGESFVDQIERARAGLAALPAGDAVLVVHSGTVRAVLAIALDLAPDSALRFVIDPLSLTRIDRLAGGWRVVAVNSCAVNLARLRGEVGFYAKRKIRVRGYRSIDKPMLAERAPHPNPLPAKSGEREGEPIKPPCS